MKTKINRSYLKTSLLLAASTMAANAIDVGVFSKGLAGETVYDRIWSAANLYRDRQNPILQEFSLQGRLQLQSIYGHSHGDSYNTSDFKHTSVANDEQVWGDDIEVRRAYIGFKSKWFGDWKVEGNIDVDTDWNDSTFSTGQKGGGTPYKDIYDLFVLYTPSDKFGVGFGKQEVKLTREGEISSSDIVTLERSYANNVTQPGNLTGAWVYGKGIADHWQYHLGVYAADRVREFSNFDGGAAILAKVGYDYSKAVGADSAAVFVRYMHLTDPGFRSDQQKNNFQTPTTASFANVIVLGNDITYGKFNLTTDIIYGFRYKGDATVLNNSNAKVNSADLFAIDIIPSYYITKKLQVVARLQVATASKGDAIQEQGRYERLATDGMGNNVKNTTRLTDERGNTYTAEYIGLNYYLYGHKLKVMSGIEFSQLGAGQYDGYTAMTGIRMVF